MTVGVEVDRRESKVGELETGRPGEEVERAEGVHYESKVGWVMMRLVGMRKMCDVQKVCFDLDSNLM